MTGTTKTTPAWLPGAMLLILSLSGCAGTPVTKAYGGPERPDRELATVFTQKKTDYSRDRGQARLAAIDGKSLYSEWDGYPFVTKILPGRYSLKVQCRLSPNLPGDFRLFQAKFEAGHFYELTCGLLSAAYIDHGTDTAASCSRNLPHPRAERVLMSS